MARQFRKLTKETVFEISRNYKTLKEFVKVYNEKMNKEKGGGE